LIVDEVLAVGDAQFQKKCLGKMEDVGKEGRTVIFVSHNMAAIQQLTTSSLVLQSGKLLFNGSTAKATDCYLSTVMDDATTYIVANTPRKNKGLNGRVVFLQLELESHPNKLVAANSKIHFKIVVKGNELVDRFSFGMTIFCLDGTPVGNLFTTENNSVGQGENAEFRIEIEDLNLAPGKYYCGISTGTGNHLNGRVDFDIVNDVLHFEVLPPEGVDGTSSHWGPWWGTICWNEQKAYRIAQNVHVLQAGNQTRKISGSTLLT
jgi:lipopolysaccharide transport system ATP-binding protein